MQGSEAGRARLEMLERQTQEKLTRLDEGDSLESDAELEAHLERFNHFVQELSRTMDQRKSKMGNSRIEKESLNERLGEPFKPLPFLPSYPLVAMQVSEGVHGSWEDDGRG